jgi:tellurite methyltransferase
MSGTERVRWDTAYHELAEAAFPPTSPFLLEFAPPLFLDREYRACDVASGMGQNGLWLAAQGYLVDLIDISRVALLRAQAEASRRGLHHLNLLPHDLEQNPLPEASYDLVCVFRYLQRDLFTPLRKSVVPGGRIIYETFNKRYLAQAADFNPVYCLELGELYGYFADWQVLHHSEDGHLSRIVALKP